MMFVIKVFQFFKLLVFSFGLLLILSNCGVKGQPQVPDYPPYIGNGLNEDSGKHTRSDSVPKPEDAKAIQTATPTPEPVETLKLKADQKKSQRGKGKKK